MRTLVLGLGNDILSDDAVGLLVARRVAERVSSPDVHVVEANVGGIGLLDLLSGYDRAILVDAICTGRTEPGTLTELSPDELPTTPRCASTHEIGLAGALELGRCSGQPMPREVRIIAIEVEDPYTFGEQCTERVARAIPDAVERVIAYLSRPLPSTG